MREFWETVQGGYLELTGEGQFLALFFLSMVALGFYKEKKESKYWIYSLVMTGLLLFPLSAWILLKYQTRFYGYGHLWALVPVTGITAWGAVALVDMARDQLPKDSWLSRRKYGAGVLTGLFCLIIFMGGSMTLAPLNRQETVNEQKIPAAGQEVLEWICDNVENPKLWAPAKVLEYARAYSGDLRLVYGRNMWDHALNAYTYDQYDETLQELYKQMEQAAKGELWEQDELETALDEAREQGCNVVVLPVQTAEAETPGDRMGGFVCSVRIRDYTIWTGESSGQGKAWW